MHIVARNVFTALTRRQVLTAGLVSATALGVAVPRAAAAPPQFQLGLGIAGGGRAKIGDRECEFTIAVTSISVLGVNEDILFGRIEWSDPDWQDGKGLTLTSVSLTSYEKLHDPFQTSETRGTMQVNGGDAVAFTLRASDGGAFGSGKDTVVLTVGDSGTNGGFGYVAEGTVVVGGLEWLEVPEDDED
jgi:hypothetical protein